jgi:adenylate kinase
MSSAYILYGKSGSGKGTQGHLLQKYLEQNNRSVIYIETGKLFRDFIDIETSYTAQCTKHVMDNGLLMPAFFPIYIWSKQLIQQYSGSEDIIFDGIARRPEEVAMVLSALEFFKITNVHVIVMSISDDEALQRLQNRHEGRSDDMDMDKIRHRLDWYTTNVIPAIDIYRHTPGVQVHDIDGIGSIDEIFERIKISLSLRT